VVDDPAAVVLVWKNPWVKQADEVQFPEATTAH